MEAELILNESEPKALRIPIHYLSIRRILELFYIIVISPLVIIILILTAGLIKFDSHGPAIISQKRFGMKRKIYSIYKFRTMKLTNGSAHYNIYKSNNITKLGRFLRKHRIDELPQLLNVIKGDMSLIGPRPDILSEHEEYSEIVRGYENRLSIKPGVTGWAQVEFGHSHDAQSAREKLVYDLEYINNISIKKDIYIFFKTFKVLWNGFGAR